MLLDDDGAATDEQRHHAQRLQPRHAADVEHVLDGHRAVDARQAGTPSAARDRPSPCRASASRSGAAQDGAVDLLDERQMIARHGAGRAPPDSRERRLAGVDGGAEIAAPAAPTRPSPADGPASWRPAAAATAACPRASAPATEPYEVYCAIFDACVPRMNGLVGLVPPSSTSSGPLRSGATSSGNRFRSEYGSSSGCDSRTGLSPPGLIPVGVSCAGSNSAPPKLLDAHRVGVVLELLERRAAPVRQRRRLRLHLDHPLRHFELGRIVEAVDAIELELRRRAPLGKQRRVERQQPLDLLVGELGHVERPQVRPRRRRRAELARHRLRAILGHLVALAVLRREQLRLERRHAQDRRRRAVAGGRTGGMRRRSAAVLEHGGAARLGRRRLQLGDLILAPRVAQLRRHVAPARRQRHRIPRRLGAGSPRSRVTFGVAGGGCGSVIVAAVSIRVGGVAGAAARPTAAPAAASAGARARPSHRRRWRRRQLARRARAASAPRRRSPRAVAAPARLRLARAPRRPRAARPRRAPPARRRALPVCTERTHEANCLRARRARIELERLFELDQRAVPGRPRRSARCRARAARPRRADRLCPTHIRAVIRRASWRRRP